jgi:hypothetical protein
MKYEELATRQQISIMLSSGIDAIRANYSGSAGDTLDIVDALEVELRAAFGNNRATTFLQQIGAPGSQDTMARLHELAVQRRFAQKTLADTSNRRAFELMQAKASANGVADILNIDKQTIESLRLKGVLGFDVGDINDYLDRITQGEVRPSADTMSAKAAAFVRAQAILDQYNTPGATIDDIQPINESEELSRLSTTVRQIAQKDEDEFQRLLAGTFDIADADPTIARSPYKRILQSIKDGELGKLLQKPGTKMAALATGALIVGSFAYQARKDHTASDIQGPPLLPGGNPYEGQYPTRQSVYNEIQAGGSNQSGVQYRINTSGSMDDLNKLRGLLGGVVDGPTDTTMYNGLPRLGQDPYSDVASRF